MKYYTKKGDGGMTDLMMNGKFQRVSKKHSIIVLLGKLDLLNADVGCCPTARCEKLESELTTIQSTIYRISGHIGYETALPDLVSLIADLESSCDFYAKEAGSINGFIIPRGNYHRARTMCRTVEIESYIQGIDENIPKFLNRLSDYLFAAGRYYNIVILKRDELYAKLN